VKRRPFSAAFAAVFGGQPSVARFACCDIFHIPIPLCRTSTFICRGPPFGSPSTFETIQVLRRIGFSSTRTVGRPASLWPCLFHASMGGVCHFGTSALVPSLPSHGSYGLSAVTPPSRPPRASSRSFLRSLVLFPTAILFIQ
jgi:hypothetical protein